MRKISLILIIFLILIILVYPKKEKEVLDTNKENKNKMLSIMVESEAGTGNYKDASSFPSTGYYLNKKLSKCVNGSKISFNNGSLSIKGNKTDRCYAYFDKDELGSICRGQNMAECFIQNYQKDKAIIYHDGKADYPEEENYELEAEDLSYRYTGKSSEVHNYICLDDKTTKNECSSSADLYQIIGLFQNEDKQYEIKLFKRIMGNPNVIGDSDTFSSFTDGYYYAYYWHSKYENYEDNSNEWKSSILNKINLNTNFINYLKENAKYIVNHKYIIGGLESITVRSKNAKEIYKREIGEDRIKVGENYCYTNKILRACTEDDLIYEAKIGLIYISDYMYGAIPKYWSYYGASAADTDYRSAKENWLFLGETKWTITRIADTYNSVFYISGDGGIGPWTGKSPSAVFPTFYLNSLVKIVSGNGTIDNPYRITLE